jgi:hypothetical protein
MRNADGSLISMLTVSDTTGDKVIGDPIHWIELQE